MRTVTCVSMVILVGLISYYVPMEPPLQYMWWILCLAMGFFFVDIYDFLRGK